MYLELSLYVKIGFYSGFISITLFEKRWTFKQAILGPLLLQPKPFPDVAKLNDQTGLLTIQTSDIGDVTCDSKAGTVGIEGKLNAIVSTCLTCTGLRLTNLTLATKYVSNDKDIQCWESSKDPPIIKNFEGVKKARVSSASNMYIFSCIQSDIIVSAQRVLLQQLPEK